MNLTIDKICKMLDVSAVQSDCTESDVRKMAELACKYNCIACFALPSYTDYLATLLIDNPLVGLGGVVGFPSGGSTTSSKVAEAYELIEMGCDELDMVINIGRMKSGDHTYIYNDIYAVVVAAGSLPVKVILECAYFNDHEIERACRIAIDAGVAFIKTGTGWTPTGATSENITLIKNCVGNQAQVKAAGGVRDLDTLLALHALGASRFGVSYKSAILILQEMENRENESLHHRL